MPWRTSWLLSVCSVKSTGKKYLHKLPDNFEFPVFNAKPAVASQRQNGYRNMASAAREWVDNSGDAARDASGERVRK
jgi:hypothetical protein